MLSSSLTASRPSTIIATYETEFDLPPEQLKVTKSQVKHAALTALHTLHTERDLVNKTYTYSYIYVLKIPNEIIWNKDSYKMAPIMTFRPERWS